MLLAPEVRLRKSQCFSSPWWPVEREPDIYKKNAETGELEIEFRGRPIRQIVLSQPELFQLGHFGFVEIHQHGRVTVA